MKAVTFSFSFVKVHICMMRIGKDRGMDKIYFNMLIIFK